MKPAVLLAALAAGSMIAHTAEAQVRTKVKVRDQRPQQADDDEDDDERDNTSVKIRRMPPVGARGFAPTSGPVGTRVSIKGTFAKEAKVRIGAKLIDPDRVGPRQLVFTVPPGPSGAHKVAIEGPNGTLPVGSFEVTNEITDDDSDDDSAGARPAPPPKAEPPAVRQPPERRRGRDRLRGRPIVSGFSPRAGKTGAIVTIYGRNFHDMLVVKLGGREVEALEVGPRAIVIKVPKIAEEPALITLAHPGARRELVVGQLDIGKPDRAAERKKEWEQRRVAAEARWKERRAQLAKDRATRFANLKQREAERAQKRAERRAQTVAAMKARWKRAFLEDEQTLVELALHAERTARLERIQRLAEAADEGKIVIRAQLALEREDKRHQRRMDALEAQFDREGGAR